MAWQFVLTDLQGVTLGEVTNADERKVTLPHLRIPTASFKVPLYHDRANDLLTTDTGVVSFYPKETYYGRVIDKDKALDYFEQRAMMDEVTEPKIVMARVNEIVRDALEQNESLPEGLDFYPRRFITITKAK